MTLSPVRLFRRSISLGIMKIGGPIERRLIGCINSSSIPRLDVSTADAAMIEDALRMLRERWPFGYRLVQRYVVAVISGRTSDSMGFVTGVWSLKSTHQVDGRSRESTAIWLVKRAILRKAYLIGGWQLYLFSRHFFSIGDRYLAGRRTKLFPI